LNLKQVANSHEFTFNNGQYKNKFDRMWLSSSMDVIEDAHVPGPCNSEDEDERVWYNDNVSDHCPVIATIEHSRSQD
jgi:hypothetical protein